MKRCHICMMELGDNALFEGYTIHPIVGHEELLPVYICPACALAYNKWAVSRQREMGTRK